MIAFLLDQGVPRTAVDHLRAAGHDAVHTAGLGLASADDEVISLMMVTRPEGI